MIPLYKPHIEQKEIDAVLRVLKSKKLSRGAEVEKFEQEFADYTKQKYAVAVNSGTSGLHLAVRTLGWGPGDEVITTSFSFIASANALLFEGVTPVFVDIDPVTLNIDVSKIEAKITKKTKGILLVHILGLPAHTSELMRLKKKYNLQIIEDACEAVGRPDKDFNVTKIGEFSIYGFHENKQLTTAGEGGMIVTNDEKLAKKCWSMRDQGRAVGANWLDNVILGFNFRLTEMQAAFGRAQLKSLDKILKRRDWIAQKYSILLKDVTGINTPHVPKNTRRSWFVYFVIFDTHTDRDRVREALTKADIASSTNYFPPIHTFPMYKNHRAKGFEHAENISKRLLVLPIFYDITETQIKHIVSTIKKALAK